MKINYRIIISIAIAFVVTAYLQDIVPPFGGYDIKIPFILGAFIYYLFRHKLVFGIIAAVFCSILGDGFSESSGIAYLISSIIAIFANCFILKKQLPENSISCGIIAFPLSILVLLVQYLSLVIFVENVYPLSIVIPKLLITSLFSVVATIVISELIYRFELIIGNKEVVDEELG